jgi:hypothetical protein
MVKPRVYADFHNADSQGRLRLNCIGTIEDLAEQNVHLRDGLLLTLYSDDVDDEGQPDELQVDGVVSFSEAEHCWVAAIDWAAIHHASEISGSLASGNGPSLPSLPKESGRIQRGT